MSTEIPEPHTEGETRAEEWKSKDAHRILRRHEARRRLWIILFVLVVLLAGDWLLNRSFSLSLNQVISLENQAENGVITELSQTFSAPPPLRAPSTKRPPSSSPLTIAGVITDTNFERKTDGGLPPLAENSVLDDVAALRLDDMFQNQYFAHVSPYSSSSAETVAKTVGYSYLSLGENLALGNFTGDQDVVNAWMASPGHRANILETHYTQIGVAVRKGTFDGESTWIAVQVFGRPSSDCPAPDPSLKTNLDSEDAQLTQMEADLANKKAAIDAMNPQYGSAYNQAVDEYNAEVNQYNALLAQTKADIAAYNAAVVSYNACIGA